MLEELYMSDLLYKLKCTQCGGNLIRNNDMCSCPNCGTDYLITALLQNNSASHKNNAQNSESVNDPTIICDEQFLNRRDLKTFNISPDVRIIGNRAFCGCSSLESISIPSSVISIGVNAFRDCYSLSHIVLPNSLEKLGHDAFKNTSIKELEFSEETANKILVDHISNYGVNKIILPDSWKVKDPSLFGNLTPNVYVRQGKKQICIGRNTGYFNEAVNRAVVNSFSGKAYFKGLLKYISKNSISGIKLHKNKSLSKNTFWVLDKQYDMPHSLIDKKGTIYSAIHQNGNYRDTFWQPINRDYLDSGLLYYYDEKRFLIDSLLWEYIPDRDDRRYGKLRCFSFDRTINLPEKQEDLIALYAQCYWEYCLDEHIKNLSETTKNDPQTWENNYFM